VLKLNGTQLESKECGSVLLADERVFLAQMEMARSMTP
jgi:hypothetical protein